MIEGILQYRNICFYRIQGGHVGTKWHTTWLAIVCGNRSSQPWQFQLIMQDLSNYWKICLMYPRTSIFYKFFHAT